MKTKLMKGVAYYRLTLAADAFAMVLTRPVIKIKLAVPRDDGRWDCFVFTSTKDVIATEAEPGENWSDTVKRLVLK